MLLLGKDMETALKVLVALLPILIAEIFLRGFFGRDTNREIIDAGTFPRDAQISAEVIAKRRHRIAASLVVSYGLVMTGVMVIIRKPVFDIAFVKVNSSIYGIAGVILGLILFVLTIVFARNVRSIHFRKENPQSHWKSFLTAPIRGIVYIYNFFWLLS
jgi:hypothetical protein